MSAADPILRQARFAAATLAPQIIVELGQAANTCDRADTQRALRRAIETAKELLVRLEVAETLFAATPAAPIDSSQWTGRHG